MADPAGGPSSNELLFLQLVSMFQVAAMQQLGKLIDPATQAARRDMDQAKMSIDTLDMLREKTKGNLSPAEDEFLNKVLFELHMNYVDELKRVDDKKTETKPKTDEPGAKAKAAEGRKAKKAKRGARSKSGKAGKKAGKQKGK